MQVTDQDSPTIPVGFKPTPMGGAFIAANGPFYLSQADGRARLGLRVERRHCNLLGICHGGLLTTLADMIMPVAVYNNPTLDLTRRFLPTVSIQIDFLVPAPMGAWVEGEGEVLKVTRSLVFVQGALRSDGEIALRCSGIYKIAGEIPEGSPGMFTYDTPDAAPSARAG